MMIEAIVTSLIIGVTGLVILLSGRFVKRNMLFSVYVPDNYRKEAEVRDIIKQFRVQVITAAVLSAMVNFIVMLSAGHTAVIILMMLLNLLLIIDVLLYRNANEKMKALKERDDWMVGVKMLRTANTAARDDLALLPWQIYLIPFALLTLSVIYTALNYSHIPDRIAVHWNINNEADRWEDKSIGTVFYSGLLGYGILLLLIAVNSAISCFPMMLNPAAKEASQQYESSVRRNNSYLMFIIAVVVSLMFSFILVQPLLFPPGYMPGYVMLVMIAGMIIPIVLSIIYQFRADKKYRETAAVVDKAPYHDDSNYKWGLFYYNKQDSSVWVPKVSQFGMTMNFARPEALLISAVILIVTLLPIILLFIFG
ncbi:DUF1648 domain-containing protein [Macrococcus equipercicus]|uniref:DUF1648 domain-containing protein n=2 Tax=Macrococcus equipercicus TaxID=69967 RepID=A0ABQ6R6F6_9STAP|nr:DUF1648 domain-containing protein [Macrococcus equipercicus]